MRERYGLAVLNMMIRIVACFVSLMLLVAGEAFTQEAAGKRITSESKNYRISTPLPQLYDEVSMKHPLVSNHVPDSSFQSRKFNSQPQLHSDKYAAWVPIAVIGGVVGALVIVYYFVAGST